MTRIRCSEAKPDPQAWRPRRPRYHCNDRQAEMLPQIEREKHRAKLAKNGEDTQ